MGLEPKGALGPEAGLSQSPLGHEEGLKNRAPKSRGYLALSPCRQIESQSSEYEKDQGNGEASTPSALLRRIRVAGHRRSSSAWSGAKGMNQVVSTVLYFWTSSRILPAPLTTQVRGSSST